MIKSLIRALPFVAKRDRRIAELESERQRLQDRLQEARKDIAKRPSFFLFHKRLRYTYAYGISSGMAHPIAALNPKPPANRFAQSHGVDVPGVLGEFDDFAELPWQSLPDAFVIKPNVGRGSHGVLPLVRRGDKYFDLLAVGKAPRTSEQVNQYLERLAGQGRISRDIEIQELLFSPHHDDDTLAPDVKLYCFYGEVGLIMCRMSNGSRLVSKERFRFFNTNGGDVGQAILGKNVDPAIPEPLHLADLVDAGRSLSTSLRVPFVRLDFFERKDQIVFGEVTTIPGGKQRLRGDLDRRLGKMWIDAELRIANDLEQAGWSTAAHGSRPSEPG